MRNLCSLVTCLSLWVSTPSIAGSNFTPGTTGFGISVGDFGGLTLYHKLSDQNFVQAMISRDLLLAADYAYTFPGAVPSAPNLVPFVGGGGFAFSTRYWDVYEERGRRLTGIGARIPLGVLVQFPTAPVHIHADVTPTCTVIPFVESFLAVQVGVRFIL
jgi:hypothetical protein